MEFGVIAMKKKLFSFSLSPKLFAASLIPLLLVTIYAALAFTAVTKKIIEKNLTEKTVSSSLWLSGCIENVLNPSISKMENWQAIVNEISEAEILHRVIRGFSADLEDVSMFYYATEVSRFEAGGFFINSINWVPPENWEPRERPWFNDALANRRTTTFSDPYIDSNTGKLCITFSKAVKNSKGDVVGVAGLDVTLDKIVDMVGKINISKNSSVCIVTKKGLYMTNPDPKKIMAANYFDDSDLFKASERNKNAPASIDEYLDGTVKSFIMGNKFYAVSQIGTSPWYVVTEGPVKDFVFEFQRHVAIIICILLLLSFICTFINMKLINSLREKEAVVSEKLFAETQNLVVAAKENSATSQDQSAAVKEIVATMEDNTHLSESISAKVSDVNSLAHKTSSDVNDGVASLEDNVVKLREIFEANQNTIDGIKDLGIKIENIWDIVTLINSVADQAKIIAFNAELEASSAGEAGKNFHIVATEIRRLADGIIDGTKEIKEKINEIQQSSDRLILASESGTEKIHQGRDSAKVLEEKFKSIMDASGITAESTEAIVSIIKQQSVASEQILLTLKQISSGVDNFSQATENISNSAENVRAIAETLKAKRSVKSEAETT